MVVVIAVLKPLVGLAQMMKATWWVATAVWEAIMEGAADRRDRERRDESE